MNYIGDFDPGALVTIYFNTFTSNDPAASATITNFVNTDVHVHKGTNLTQRNNAAGVTVDVDVDAITGTHSIEIDTADNTVADFWVGGFDYFVRIEGTTVDGGTVNAVVGHFSIENRRVAGEMIGTDIATLASQTSFTLGIGSADDDAYNDCTIIVTDQVTPIQKAIGRVSDYTGSTKTVTLVADPGIFTMATGDGVSIIATSALANLVAVGSTAQTAGDIPALVNTVDTVVDAIKLETDKLTLNDAGAGAAGSIVEEVQNTATPAQVATELATYDGPTKAEMDTAHALLATEAKQDIIDTNVDDIETAVGVAGAGLTDLGGMSTGMKAEVESEVDDALDNAIPASPTADSINEVAQQLARSVKVVQEFTIDNTSFTATTTAAQVDAVDIGSLEATDDHYIGRIIVFTVPASGGNLRYQATNITDYDGTNKRFTYTALTEAPADNDTFIVV